MSCPECGEPTAVVDSRAVGSRVRRRRVCDNDHRFTTYELLATEHEALEAAAYEVTAAVTRLLGVVEMETPALSRTKKYRPRAA